MASNRVSPARWAALEILRKVDRRAFSSVLLAAEETHLEPSDRALCHELVLGVLRWQFKLDKIIEHFSNRKIESLDQSVLIALRLGLYQLRFLTRIPASAAVDESVRLVQAARLSSARGFVNALLRRATREPDYDPADNVADPVVKLAIAYSHPEWLIRRWLSALGFDETVAFVKANNETPPISFRVVRTKADQQDVLTRLKAAGVAVEASRLASGAWRATGGSRILRELADRGEIYLQDEASQFVAQVVDAQREDFVLDLCSAPGGKTSLIADSVDACVIAGDLNRRRLATVKGAVETQQLKRVSLLQLDATAELPFPEASFDRVLVDAPCSGTGTLRRNPEIRWRTSLEDVQRLAAKQGQILRNASRVLKPGGRLVYSTCSVEREEDEDVVTQFLSENGNFRQLRLQSTSASIAESGSLRTWPHRHGTDGFFVAAFQKMVEKRS